MIRRGMPYGDPLPEGDLEDDGADRGLLFVCFVASLSRQFEAVQIQWLGDGNLFGLGGRPRLPARRRRAGEDDGPGRAAVLRRAGGPFVTTRGGEYLFAPGLRALAALAAG